MNDRENLQRVIDFQREVAVNVLKNSLSTLDVQERNMQLAEKVYLTTKKKYEQGLGSASRSCRRRTNSRPRRATTSRRSTTP